MNRAFRWAEAHGPLAASIATVLFFTLLQSQLAIPIGHNDTSRWNTVYSLVHHGTYKIDQAPWLDTLDKIAIESEDQADQRSFISSKPAFWATVVAPVYAIATALGWQIGAGDAATKRAIDFVLFWVNILPFGWAVWIYLRFCQVHRLPRGATWFAGIAVVFGTYMTGYLFTLNNHVPAAVAVMGSLWFLYRGKQDAKPYGAALCGFCAGLSFCVELSATVWVAALALVWVLHDRKQWLWFVAGATLPIASYFMIERIAYGTWLSNQLQVLFGMGSRINYEGSPWQGSIKVIPIHNVHESWPVTWLHMMIGHHGVFSLTPLFALCVYGMELRWRHKIKQRRPLAIMFAVPLVVITAYAVRTSSYGGVCHGLRWVIWLTPIWLWQLPHVLETRWHHPVIRPLLLVTLGISVYSALDALPDPWSESWLHLAMRAWGIVPY